MKTRIILYILALFIAGFVYNGLVKPASVLVQNTATVATVNGGNDAYVAQQAVIHAGTYGWPLLGFTIISLIFWYGPISKQLNSNSSN